MIRLALLSSAALCAVAATAMGEPVIHRAGGGQLTVEHAIHHVPTRHAYVVTRHWVVAPAAVIGRELAEQPTYSHLVELRLVNTTVLIDPKENYQRQNVFQVDENQFLVKAARLANSLRKGKARIVRRPDATGVMQSEKQQFVPIMVIPKPRPDAPAIPSVPAPAENDKPLIARAD